MGLYLHMMTLIFPIANAKVYYEKRKYPWLHFLKTADRMAIISLQKKFKFSVSLLRRTWEKITLDNFASCCQQKNKPGLVECEEDSPPLVQRKKKKPHIKQIKQKHKQSLSSTPLRNNKEKSVFCFSRYSREIFFLSVLSSPQGLYNLSRKTHSS